MKRAHYLCVLFCKIDVMTEEYFKLIESNADLLHVAENIRATMLEYVQKCQLKSLVLGISGGIDSALCAALMKPVCETVKIPLIGRSITIETNSAEEINRSIHVGEQFCHDFQYVDLTTTFLENKKLLVNFDDSQLSKLRQGNMKARMRMMVLYDLAQLHRGIVISTDNFTEYLTGFWTLHGDVGDYAPIMHLWKTEVFWLATALLTECTSDQQKALQTCIDATPVDGLGISSHDCEQLGVDNYFQADEIFLDYFRGDKTLEEHPIIQRYHRSAYKRSNPLSIPRLKLMD